MIFEYRRFAFYENTKVFTVFNQKSQKVYIDFSLNFIQILIKNLQFFLGLLDSWLSIGPNIMTCYASLVGKYISLIHNNQGGSRHWAIFTKFPIFYKTFLMHWLNDCGGLLLNFDWLFN